jgi:hypothetical protein
MATGGAVVVALDEPAKETKPPINELSDDLPPKPPKLLVFMMEEVPPTAGIPPELGPGSGR